MGNLTSQPQFKQKLKEFLQAKSTKKTLKIKYKENRNNVSIIESLILPLNNLSTPLMNMNDPELLQIKDLQSLLNTQQSMFKYIQVKIMCNMYLDITEPMRYYHACTICRTKLSHYRQLQKCPSCGKMVGEEIKYCIRIKISDASGSCLAIMFDIAEQYIGISAKQFSTLSQQDQNSMLERTNTRRMGKQYKIMLNLDVQNRGNTARLPRLLNFEENTEVSD